MNTPSTAKVTMSSREIAELTGKEHKNVKRDIENMLTELAEDALKFERIYFDSMNRQQTEYHLDRDFTETLLLSYSAALRLKVIRRLREMEAALASPRPMTTAEIVLQNAQAIVDFERRQSAVENRVEQLASAVALPAKPQNSEAISEIRHRINRKHGLPERVINEVMFQLPESPKPFAMVKNGHENAKGSSFAVWMIKDVTKLFDRFCSECVQATATTVTHPYIDGRFKTVRRQVGEA